MKTENPIRKPDYRNKREKAFSNDRLKVILIHTPCDILDNDRLETPLGLLYIGTVLKNNGISCQICDLSGIPEQEWINHIDKGDVYGFSTYSVNYHSTIKIKELILGSINFGAVTIAGGPHVSALPFDCINDFNIIITGEAEKIILEVIRAIKLGKNPKGVFHGNPVQDLNRIPFVDYDMVDLSTYTRVVEGQKSLSIISSRGCCFNCTFCNSRIMSRGNVRLRSPANVALEIAMLKNKYGVTSYRFNDDLFTVSVKRVKKMAEKLKPLHILYRCFGQVNSLKDKRVCEALYDSGCRHVAIGIESMSQRMLDYMNKKTTIESNVASLKQCRDSGLKTRIYLIIGFPGETQKTFEESLFNLKKCVFDEFMVYPFLPYPGTPVWEAPDKWGVQIDKKFEKFVQVGKDRSTTFPVSSRDFTPQKIQNWREIMIQELEKQATWAGNVADNC